MPDDLDLAAMRAAAERAKDAPTATIRTLWFEGDADAEAHFNHIAACSPAVILVLLDRLERAEAVCEALSNGIDKALMEIDDAGPKALKYARQELDEALNSANKLETNT